MSSRRIAVALGLCAVAVVVAGCPGARTPAAPTENLGKRLSSDLRGPSLAGRRGDLVLEQQSLRAVIGMAGSTKGVLLDVALGAWPTDELRELQPLVMSGANMLQLEVVSVQATREGHGARVVRRAVGHALELVDDITLHDGQEVAWRTVLHNVGAPLTVRVGDRFECQGSRPFAPGFGFVDAASEAQVPWIGHRGRTWSYALAFSQPTGVSFRFERDHPGEQVALSAPVVLAHGSEHMWTRRLVLGAGGLDKVAARAWAASGIPITEVKGRVQGADGRARVEARDEHDRTVMTVLAEADGSWSLPLPLGDYSAVAHCPGGRDSSPLHVTPKGGQLDHELVAPVPGEIAVRVTDGEGATLPARITVRGVAPTENPDFGSDQLARGTGGVAYTANGEVALWVPPGTYDVLISHGPEYDVVQQRVDVTASEGARIRSQLKRLVDTSGWVACDMHVHASPSHDSRVPLPDRVTTLVAEGIGFAVATDHNVVTDYGATIRDLALNERIGGVAGVEITTSDWGHFNAFPYPSNDAAPAFDGLPGEIFQDVRARAPKALVQVNHPRMHSMGYFNRGGLDAKTGVASHPDMSLEFDTIELANGLELGTPTTTVSLLEEWFQLLNVGRRYTGVGNSDSHKVVSEWVGYPRTYVYVGVTPDGRPPHGDDLAQRVVNSLRAGRATVTNGAFLQVLVDGIGPGGRVTPPDPHVHVVVDVQAPPWIDVQRITAVVNGEAIPLDVERDGLHLRATKTIAVERDSWIVVVATGDQPLEALLPASGATTHAFSNPVWIDVDGDGEILPVAPNANEPPIPEAEHTHPHPE